MFKILGVKKEAIYNMLLAIYNAYTSYKANALFIVKRF